MQRLSKNTKLAVTATILIGAFLLVAASAPSSERDVDIRDFVNASGGTLTGRQATGELRNFTLEVHKIVTEIAPGVKVEQWAYGFPGQQATVPGPELRVKEGDVVSITFKNTHDQPHTIHLHGITRLAQDMDGIKEVLPGESYTYTFVASHAGTYAYHCHFQTYLHADMGMYGALVVEPRDDAQKVWNTEHTLVLDEWDSHQDPKAPIHTSTPNYFLVNGKSFPLAENIKIADNEVSLLRVVNMGDEPHAWHLHGMNFLKIAKDGENLEHPTREDVLFIAPGERYDILVKGRDGSFPFHDHMVKNVTNNGIYPGGMHVMIEGGTPLTFSGDVAPTSDAHAHTGHAATTDHEHAMADMPGMTAPASTPQTVHIKNFAFDHPVVHVKAGTKVTWINEDAVPHSVTAGTPGQDAQTRAFDSTGEAKGKMQLMAQGQAWSYTFDKKGTFEYYCLPHTNMTATVIVE
ncbi:multicopper oxidase domain-containing protein [Deinococcus yavapaiensis]|uniref:FtsP/CotA-like multicopper oxidase with cupredoxin domain n=1 Tax=Deinococcus yavapaiensis KR-236 TaxID=694435 RepID=A0A318STM1_9DEIO|nr:multicopper oxidase domain-containing protein [Deinococcus yavapaiensis]PYE56586.1 FtsP/CotA-like multicopper oxidase with cupredoxin domain [Deinococcus yavapaiensis KR-236]